MTQPLRILVVDDSALMRRMLIAMLQSDPAIQVVGEAADGRRALQLVAQLRPDLITMDVVMPVMNGLDTTEQIMAYYPTPILVITASLSHQDVDIGFRMLGAGALDLIEKPRGNDPQLLEQARQTLLRRVKLLARVRVVTHLRGRRKAEVPAFGAAEHVPLPQAISNPADLPVLVIGASTGGPRIIRGILQQLTPTLPAAVVIVQHIAEGFSSGMVEWLNQSSALPVRLAEDGMVLHPARAVLVPEQSDLLLEPGGRIKLSGLRLLMQRPSVDIAMQSVAACFAERSLGVLLSGMGRDGVLGMLAIKRAGGHTIAQHEASCAIFGMPRAAIMADAVHEILPPDEIPAAIEQAVSLRLGPRVRSVSLGAGS